jgi:sulfur relay (sulfurtransferase) DsrF/TusC family protein
MKNVLILCDKGPFGTNSAVEAIRLAAGLLGLGEDVDCKVVFLADAVLVMKNNLQADQIGMDSVDEGLEMSDLTDMEIILIKEDMEERGMSESDAIEYENLSIIGISELHGVINEFETVFKI